MPPTYYRGCWHVVSRGFFFRYRPFSSLPTGLYAPRCSFTHAASLHQGSPHCAISPTAASRRSLGRVSVPMWPSTLSGRLLIVALVGRYPANQLIRRGPILHRFAFRTPPCGAVRICGISTCFQVLSPCAGQVAHALLTRPPLGCRFRPVQAPAFRNSPVRLACVRHAASVHPEPGSNSHVILRVLPVITGLLWLVFPVITVFVSVTPPQVPLQASLGSFPLNTHSGGLPSRALLLPGFSGLHCCLVVKVLALLLCPFPDATLISYHSWFPLSRGFFNFFGSFSLPRCPGLLWLPQ